jgi:hypothetical protein
MVAHLASTARWQPEGCGFETRDGLEETFGTYFNSIAHHPNY